MEESSWCGLIALRAPPLEREELKSRGAILFKIFCIEKLLLKFYFNLSSSILLSVVRNLSKQQNSQWPNSGLLLLETTTSFRC